MEVKTAFLHGDLEKKFIFEKILESVPEKNVYNHSNLGFGRGAVQWRQYGFFSGSDQSHINRSRKIQIGTWPITKFHDNRMVFIK